MSLHPHQHRALVSHLRGKGYGGTSAVAAFASLPPLGEGRTDVVVAPKTLRATKFLTQAKFDKLRPKDVARIGAYVIVTAEEVAAFPTGVPGFPNKILREWFAAAWTEARDGRDLVATG